MIETKHPAFSRIRAITLLLAIAPAGPALAALPSVTVEIPAPQTPAQSEQPAGLAVQPVLRSGVAVPLAIAPRATEWEVTGDRAVWEMRIDAPDAHYLGLRLDGLMLPDDATVSLAGRDARTRGPYTRTDVGPDGRLWIPLVHGGTARLRFEAPSSMISALRIGDAELHYGVHPLDGATTKDVGDAGGCHNNVACPLGDDWDRAIRATVLLVIGNQLVCNGTLINNTLRDRDPLVLTADHCGIRSSEDDGFTADSVAAVFNFQSRQCNADTGFATNEVLAGERLLYRDRLSDTALIRLSQAPPASFGAIYGGWDASGSGADSGVGVHHPAGDLKKISVFTDPVARQTVTITDGSLIGARDQTVESWRVEWNDGVTEPGSSGSALWSPEERLIGVLSGGSSACGNSGFLGIGSTPDTLGPDFYGRLDIAFTRGGELGTPLRAFLDPAGSGARSVTASDQAAAPGGGMTGGGGNDGGGDSGGGDEGLGLFLVGVALAALRRRFTMPQRG
ncbi:trypsin-like serine peptidase [Algiphilus sp.]|uniref:trypsin-like serine peptidase n=1 Tax=Algiphilus sp. TaxID=1872431 RepID=UPI003C48737E